MPNELRKVVVVFIIAFPAAFGGKVELIPPFEFGLWRQRNLARFLASDQIATDGNECLTTYGPERGNYVGRARAPNETGEDRLVDFERIHQRADVGSNCRWLTVSKSFV